LSPAHADAERISRAVASKINTVFEIPEPFAFFIKNLPLVYSRFLLMIFAREFYMNLRMITSRQIKHCGGFLCA